MPILRALKVSALLSAAFIVACGGNNNTMQGSGTTGMGGGGTGGEGSGAGGMGTTTSSSSATVTHPALPQVADLGGPVLTAPKVQPLAWGSDANLTQIEAFLQELTKTTFWSDTTSEYKVGALTVLPTIMIGATAPTTTTDTDLTSELVTNITGTSPIWGAADPSTIYLFLIPQGTTIGDPSGGYGCQDYDGYHDEIAYSGSKTVPYAVGCSCPGFDGPAVTPIQERTVAISHELVEAATDPFPNTKPAYGQEDDADIVWTLATGGEVADMCEFNLDSYVVPPGSTYMIQRSWSNKAAKAGTNPCVPVITTDPYFNSFPVLPDMLALAGGGVTIHTPGVKIPVGSSKTIDIDLFSDAPTSGPWKLEVIDGEYAALGASTPYLQLTLDKSSGQSGDTVHLTIKVLKADTQYGMEPFILSSTLNGQNNLWMGAVGQ